MGASRAPCRVVLIGMMGCGKSSVGELLAARMSWPYYDNDVLLRMISGETAKGLLARGGLMDLREGEAAVLRVGLRQPPPCIVAAPAGTILDESIRDELQAEPLVVWLTADARTLARRVRGAAHRPWLAGDREGWMTGTLIERATLYEAVANLKVSTQRRRPAEVAAEIAAWLDERCS